MTFGDNILEHLRVISEDLYWLSSKTGIYEWRLNEIVHGDPPLFREVESICDTLGYADFRTLPTRPHNRFIEVTLTTELILEPAIVGKDT